MNRRELLASAAAASVALSAPAARAATPKPMTVAFVIGANANVMDLAGSWETFQDTAAGDALAFQLYTVSDATQPLRATGGLLISPQYAFAEAPQPDIIVMGAQRDHTPQKIEWIKAHAEKAQVVMSVCTGAFLLAKTGLLDGLSATTHHDFYERFASTFPRVHLVRDTRYVENPGTKFCSAGGITSGIELALRIVERLVSSRSAATTAYYMEYNRSSTRPSA